MKFCNMAVVVPVDQLTGSKAALSAQVWGQVSNLLMPALGKLYRQFHPANDAWGHKLTSPFGVVLGCQEPELFLTLFLTGQQTQQEAVAFHAAAMIKKVDMDKAQKAGDSLICPVVVDGSDPELMIHALWHISLQKGAPLPDSGSTMPPSGVRSHLKRNSGRFCQTLPDMPFASCGSARRWKKMTAFDRNVFVKMLLSVSQKDDAALFPKSERSPYIQKLLEAFDKEETIDLSIIDWDAFQIENVTPENYERVYHRVFDGWIQGFIHYCRKAPVFQRQERSFF